MKIVTPVVATLLQLSDFLPAGKAHLLCNTSRIRAVITAKLSLCKQGD